MSSGPLYCFYGDDFTGSTDALEAAASGGLRSVLFVGVPSTEHLEKFAGCEVVGIAGDSRSRSPAWMTEHLTAPFACLRDLGARVIHYKVCSTFDSSPTIGSIGRAMEIGQRLCHSRFVPIVVCSPRLRRYVVFGNLFAAAGAQVHRIDRHPTMRVHPTTPMTEADLQHHLAAQTTLRVGLIDLPTLQSDRAAQRLDALLADGSEAILFDGVDEATLAASARLIWEQARGQPLFAVGSSGLTYGLLPSLRRADAPDPTPSEAPGAVDRMLVLSGSCSPVTAAQIQWALRNGYTGIRLDPARLITSREHAQQYVTAALDALQATGKVVLYSALGPLDSSSQAHDLSLGRAMGDLLKSILQATPLRRVVLAGGDTSSHAIGQLGLHALTWLASSQPGAPLCRAHADSPDIDGLQLVLKGGQIGSEDFFERIRVSQ